MVRLNEMPFEDAVPIDGYGPGFFRVGGKLYQGAVICLSAEVTLWSGLTDRDALLALAGKIDVLLVGTGAEMAHIDADLRTALEDLDIGVEAMASPTACRSYNVLASEGRRVAAALLPV
ncbi:Mth938-like domain-containing protein [Celeribacter arenosi]|uniref:Mth938-like domain-containing protein n=1 Tax=Celeribacter arenosi TaxID=792649 RepID=A0ABP7KC15_9RHOB